MKPPVRYILLFCVLIFSFSVSGAQHISRADTLSIFIIAGQSNAINIHTNAADLPAGIADTAIRLYYHCGVPPDNNLPNPYFATSGKWVNMNFQIQNPYVSANDSFFGPEISMANRLKAYYGDVAIIKCAYGGSDLASDWKPNAVTGNKMFSVMKEQVNNALRILDSLGLPYKIKAFFWIQGEADAANNAYSLAYLNNLKNFVKAVRQEFGNTLLPFLISRLPSFQRTAYLYRIREAQVNICDSVLYTYWLNTDDLINCGDNTHFNSASVLKLGTRLAELLINSSVNVIQNAGIEVREYVLEQNYPNPFNPGTTINYRLPQSGQVTIKVYDVLGNEVKALVNEYKPAGEYSVNFDAGKLSSGVYIYRLTAGGYTTAKKMMLIK